ncbi:MAG: threonine dehydratase [Candidatus Azotimanducaceae bacterium]
MSVTFADVEAARDRIRSYVHETPLLSSQQLDMESGATLVFKAEHLQKVGAFKARGAANAVFSLSDTEASRGVATHSSGNHGAALARAAQLRGIPAHIVVPENAKLAKVNAISSYGGQVIRCESNLAAREAALERVVKNTGATIIHPYDDIRVIAGQGTTALEILAQTDRLDAVVIPVGGGGLLAGSSVVFKTQSKVKVYGAEPASADDAYRSFKSGVRVTSHIPRTIADGLQTTLGETNFAIIRERVDDILLVSEDEIVAAMRLIWSRLKQVVEPSSAVTLAAVLKYPELFRNQKVCLVLTGGNLDLDDLPF